MYIKSIKTKKSYDIDSYKIYRNCLNRIIRCAERQYYSELVNKNKSDIKSSWKIINAIIHRKKRKVNNTIFYENTVKIDQPQIISQKFNNFFSNVGINLSKEIPRHDIRPTQFIRQRIDATFFVDPVEQTEIDKIIKNLKDSASGWDDIMPRVVKHARPFLCLPLVHLCNLSFSTGVFPFELKIAHVIPLFKAGDPSCFSNYRPVSILSIFSKIFERLMFNRLSSFLQKYAILYDFQFGFRPDYSTEYALVTLVNNVSKALDDGNSVVGVFLDFSKAFDTVDHDILMAKLEFYGIRGIGLKWFQDYLSNRSQYVTYNNCKSTSNVCKCGVPQGSILGPLLFLIYINDLASNVRHCLPVLYADDTNLFFTGKSLTELTETINDELKHIDIWLQVNKLSLNVSKTQYMIFTYNKKVNDIPICITDNPINRVYSSKFLGVIVDCKLSWRDHVCHISKKISKCFGILIKAKRILSYPTMLTLYYTFVYPYFIYCNIVWGCAYKTVLERLHILQKKIIRMITFSPYKCHTEPLFFKTKILDIFQINQYMNGIFVYKFMNSLLPSIFSNLFVINTGIHSINTRNKDAIRLPKCKLTGSKHTISYVGGSNWNEFPDDIKSSLSIYIFKRTLKSYLIAKSSNISAHY